MTDREKWDRSRRRDGWNRRRGSADGSSGTADDHHQSAARFRSARRADNLFLGPRHHRSRPAVQRHRAAQHGDQASVHRSLVGRGPGVERARALSGVERHPQQSPDALVGGRRSRQRVPLSVEQQQRQHVRLPGSAALLRASHPPRGALRARRDRECDRRFIPRQAAQLAERRRATSGRQLLVHRSALWRPALRGRAGCGGRPEQRGRPAQSPHRPACRLRARPPRIAHQLLSRRPERTRRPRCERGPGSGSQWAPVLARLQEALRHQHRPRAGRCRAGRQGRYARVRRRL